MEEKNDRKWRKDKYKVGTEEVCKPSKHHFIHKGCRHTNGIYYNEYECTECGYRVTM